MLLQPSVAVGCCNMNTRVVYEVRRGGDVGAADFAESLVLLAGGQEDKLPAEQLPGPDSPGKEMCVRWEEPAWRTGSFPRWSTEAPCNEANLYFTGGCHEA